MSNIEQKRVFLLACGSEKLNEKYTALLKAHFRQLSFFYAADGKDILFKVENAPPHVVIFDARLPRASTKEIIPELISKKHRLAAIVLGPESENQTHVDEVVTGQVQFMLNSENESLWIGHINRALNWVSEGEDQLYHIRFYSANDRIIKEGEPGRNLFFIKSGRLKACVQRNGKELILGYIEPGEFVGEMAFINEEPRSADVICLSDTELIEIPHQSLDSLLFSKPSWSKALMKSLSRRIKTANDKEFAKK